MQILMSAMLRRLTSKQLNLCLLKKKNIVQFREDFQDFQDTQMQAFRYNGWIAEEGTPLKVALASAQEADEEIAIRRYNAQVGRREYLEGAAERMQGTLNKMYGQAARRAGQYGAIGSLLGSASRLVQA